MIKILVADDEADLQVLVKQKFRRQIREGKYGFLFALNGREALEKVEANPDVEVVLSDIRMPEMDGLTLLGKFNEINPLIKTIMVSAYGDLENIRCAMNRGAFDFVCKPINFEDLELTIEKAVRQVAQLKETLQAIKENNILRMYVDDHVLKFMATPGYEASLLTSETVDASVVFIDICHFTAISEQEPAGVVVGLLNTYFDVMVKEILVHGGYIDKFIGDAIMAVFRGDYHLDRAVEAALAVRKEIDALPGQLPGRDFAPRVAIGINSGEMVSGNIGSASLRRLDYTVIGDVVNTAQRLQSIAQPGQIFINELCYERIKESFHCQQIGAQVLRNKTAPSMIYEVVN